MFSQGEEGTSWYIILKGSVNVVIYGKVGISSNKIDRNCVNIKAIMLSVLCAPQGVVCTLHEGDDFGKLALVNDAPRAASIVLREDNCHFLRVDKEDFNTILRASVCLTSIDAIIATVTKTTTLLPSVGKNSAVQPSESELSSPLHPAA